MTIKNLGKIVLFQCPITLQNQTKRMINVTISLTFLRQTKLPTFIKWTSPFSSSWLLGFVFHSYSNFNRTSCKHAVELVQTLQYVASDLGLYYLSMSHKKNTRLIWVKYYCCILCYSHQLYCFFIELDNDWIYNGFNHMNRHDVCHI